MADVYNENAPKLIERGFYVHPIAPKTKKPGEYVPSEDKYRFSMGWTHPRRPIVTSPQPGAGIGLRCGAQPGGGYVVAIDWDNEDAAIAAMDAFPPGVSKSGKRGFTSFHFSPAPIPARDFLINKATAVQVLGDGRQTVLPPSEHPDTGQPYCWDSKHTLYDVRPSDLPRLPTDYIERIEMILRPLGYEPEPEKPKSNGHDQDDDNPYKVLNKLALRNLVAWVPELGLYGLKRNRGFHASYLAVATWRPSSTGRPLEQRKPNLSISGAKGITDFGTGETFSSIDLVMRARSCTLSDAVAWLSERVRPDDDKVHIDFDALGGKEPPKDEPREEAKSENSRKKGRFKFTPSWEMRPNVAEEAYLIDELIPAKGIVLLWGPPKCLKSFFVLDMMWHVGNGWEYRDRAVHQGATLICAFEGSHGYSKRVEALRCHHELPLDGSDRTPVHVMSGKTDLVRDHALLVQEMREYLAHWSVAQPVAVVLDTLNKSLVGSEGKDLDMASYIRAAEAVRDAFDCVVIIVHHCGWDESRMRGHSSLRGAVDAEIAIVREGDVVTATVEEMRDGPDGVQIVSKSRIVEVGIDKRGRPLTSLVIVPHEPIAGEGTGTPRNKWPPSLKAFREALVEVTLTSGLDYQIEGGPKVRAADLERVRTTFYALHVVASDEEATAEARQTAKRMAFNRALDRARACNLIGARSLDDGRQLIWLVHPETSHAPGA